MADENFGRVDVTTTRGETMANTRIKYLAWLTALVVIMACAPTFANPPVATLDPNAVGTYIVETANVASSKTAAAIPTNTPTATSTSTPRFTDTPEPTATATIVFRFNSPTPRASVTSTSSNSTSDKTFACEVISVKPANGTVYPARTDFDGRWSVKNTGKKNWDTGSIDYIYLKGDKFHKVEAYDLKSAVKVGETADIIVDMIAPKDAGSYSTNWSLRVGQETFCTLALTIVVK
jgi:hypothetical protein